MKGFIILIGILLLIGSIFVASKVVDQQHSSGEAPHQKLTEDASKPPAYVVCWGHFDVEAGVAGMYPKQPGDIVKLASENTPVKEGDVLLQIDDTLARLKIEQAEAVAVAAEKHYDEAKLLVEQHKLQRDQQEAVVREVGHEIKKVSSDRDYKLQTLEKDNPNYKNVIALYKETLAQLDEKKIVEQAKLEQVKLLDAKLKIAQAEADWKVKLTLVKEAREMLKHFKIVAPSNGTVLRVHVHKGETLGSNSRTQALDFLPDSPVIVRAEVLQEWGRFVEPNQDVIIEDDTYNGPTWNGKVKSLSKWYATIRSPVIEPFRYNDVRTLECLIDVKDDGAKKFIGQRIRAKIKI